MSEECSNTNTYLISTTLSALIILICRRLYEYYTSQKKHKKLSSTVQNIEKKNTELNEASIKNFMEIIEKVKLLDTITRDISQIKTDSMRGIHQSPEISRDLEENIKIP